MALRCASDVGPDEPGLAAAPSPLRPHLELVLVDEPERASSASPAAANEDVELPRPGRWASLVAAAVVAVALAVATLAALAVYGALP